MFGYVCVCFCFYIYLSIYLCVCVCVCVCVCLFVHPSTRVGFNSSSIFKQSSGVLNSEISISYAGCAYVIWRASIAYYISIVRGSINQFKQCDKIYKRPHPVFEHRLDIGRTLTITLETSDIYIHIYIHIYCHP